MHHHIDLTGTVSCQDGANRRVARASACVADEADWSNVHQAIYPLYMEPGRWDVAIRSGLGRWMLKQRCAGILGAQMIRYYRPLKRFQIFELRTRVIGWDKKWFYMEHRLESRGLTMTVGYVQIMFLSPEGKRIQPATAMLACGGDVNSPPSGSIPELLARFAHNRQRRKAHRMIIY